MPRPFVIGFAGGSGSGKSTLVSHLLGGRCRADLAMLPHDAYYLDGRCFPAALGAAENFDHPDALDNALYVEHLDCLRAGQTVERPVYDFKAHSRTGATESVSSRPVVLLDGILLFAVPEIRAKIDLRVYVDTPAEERLARRLLRDITERGRTPESVVHQFRTTVRPMHDRFVEPSRAHAHIIVPWDWECDHHAAVAVVESRVAAVTAVHPAPDARPGGACRTWPERGEHGLGQEGTAIRSAS